MSLSERSLNSVNQNVLGLVALLVSLVALLTTVLQVLQQYFSSAEGYRRCAESVMGLWYKGTHRKLRFHEFRFEVVFETPVIFVAPPDNIRGPIDGRAIHYIDGTPESYENTRVLSSEKQDSADRQAIQRVQTADDERASWLTLLSVLQRKEKESRKWDEQERCEKQKPPRGGSKALIGPPQYGLTVGLQSKTRSWDFMPAAITKPYATSAICHLVEMMSMLGLYWKVFDQELWNLRAEGNGHILTSTQVHGLGLMVTFAVTGKSKFQENRVIPHDALKGLAFGTVPNIFDDTAYQKVNEDARTIDLQFGEPDEVAHTLESLGCSLETIERFQKDHKHIFSVSFEIVAMLAKVFRIRGSNFRMIPNPTADNWLKNPDPRKASWKITLLMQIFQRKLAEIRGSENFSFDRSIITTISEHWVIINREGCSDDDAKLSIEAKEAIHNAIDDVDKYLLQDVKQADYINVLVSHLDTVMEILSDAKAQLNSLVLANKEEPFLRNYFENVLPTIRDKPDAVGKRPSDEEKKLRTTIWLILIFRMLCWLLLHDFDSHDVKRVPSNLKGSRMPVFIG